MMGPELPLSNVAFVRFDESGRITDIGQQSAYAMHIQQTRGDRIVAGVGAPETHWVNDGEVKSREPNPAELDGMTVTGLPMPSTVTIEGEEHLVEDGEAEMSFAFPGTYTVTVDSGPRYLPASFEVVAP